MGRGEKTYSSYSTNDGGVRVQHHSPKRAKLPNSAPPISQQPIKVVDSVATRSDGMANGLPVSCDRKFLMIAD